MSEQILGIGSRVQHNDFGIGVITAVMPHEYRITFMKYGQHEVPRSETLEVIEAIAPDEDAISFGMVQSVLTDLLEKWNGIGQVVELGDKWKGGTLILKPANDDLKPKEIPIETFFHKIVMVRDRLRVMEQRINSSKVLSDEDKVNLQQYLTRIYGSLTTFNVLFKYKKNHFSGSRS